MKKFIALLVTLLMVLTLAACGGDQALEEEVPVEETLVEETPVEEVDEEAPAESALSEEDADAAREAGTLASDALTGYEKYENSGNWHYSNYPNYKDFNADGKLKVAFVCKSSNEWFASKAESLGKTVEDADCEYLFIDVKSAEQTWMDMIRNVISQNFDAVVMTPVDTAQLPEAIAMLQEAGIAYMTTDDFGIDNYAFYAPHCGRDDYYLHYELGKYVASKIAEENWMDDVAEDHSNLLFVIQDSLNIDYIHLRNQAFVDGILESYDIPEDCIVWLDCGDSGVDEVADKFASVVQDNVDTIDKWIVSAAGTASISLTMDVFEEADVDLADVKFADCFTNIEPLELMMSDPAVAACSYGVCLSSARSGVIIGEILIDLFNNGTPIPAFTGYDLVIADAASVEECYDSIMQTN